MEVKVASSTEGKNTLLWATAKEWENSHFEIERSTNGIDGFEKIGEITGMGWSSSVTAYSYDDRKINSLSGNIYYRIKQVDFNGNSDYSQVVVVKLAGNPQTTSQWKAYPNPSTGSDSRISVTNFGLSSAEYVHMRMISSSFQSEPVRARYGDDLDIEISEAVKKAPRGIVIIELVWDEKVSHLKIMKN